jgi:hypothetical protein
MATIWTAMCRDSRPRSINAKITALAPATASAPTMMPSAWVTAGSSPAGACKLLAAASICPRPPAKVAVDKADGDGDQKRMQAKLVPRRNRLDQVAVAGGVYCAYIAARTLTAASAMDVSFASAAFSSISVFSSSWATSALSSCFDQAMSEPYRVIS